ncbi:MAG: MtrAB system histidine kinase MtrB [Microbacterium sp.]|uniref:MtrAB system histidine kinase MtrB n=1 Tax=Microbacterium sp. TaxID=51671 RepID=UPI00260CE07A|nr:MtrAB system histidine kinase MtrB [Microbacterium sp.]MCX6501875.1 MtrAB system histidine kinase MtrB [Microbacterium sp.]
MTSALRRRAAFIRWLRSWRRWPEQVARLWLRSLRFRTVVVTVVCSSLAILVAWVWMALAIQNDLFQSRRTEALDDAARATAAAQETLDSSVQTDTAQVRNVFTSVASTLNRLSSSDRIAMLRVDSSPSANAPVPFALGGDWDREVSDELRTKVASAADLQWWQSIELTDDRGARVPGIVVGQQVTVPGVGAYELYIAYDLGAAAQTLGFVQGTLWFVGIALILIIGAISWIVVRSITAPIGQAALTSAQLAAGRLDVRVDIHGDDELAILGRSFNAMADSIQTQIKELADLSLVQQRFVSDVSHELRTPLTTIRLAADVINDHRAELNPVAGRAAELLYAQVQRFEVLLTDLLEISRYDAGSVQLEIEPTSLAHLAEDVVASMQELAAQHGIEVRVVAPGGYSPVDMDPRRVRRVVRNLLGNAIEHGEGRPVVVTVDSDQDAVALGVRDFGLGMREEDTERVFDRFWRADPSRKRTIGGTGLGLSIALGDARLHGGTLSVWSAPGRGSNFVLTLPRRAGSTTLVPPVPVDPGDAATEDLGMTQPIGVPDRDGARTDTGGRA